MCNNEIALKRELVSLRKILASHTETYDQMMLMIIKQSCELLGDDLEEMSPAIAKRVEEAGLNWIQKIPSD